MSETTPFPMADHPDLVETRERYERASASGPAVITDGLVLLGGLWLAISPWTVHFNGSGVIIAVLGVAAAAIAPADRSWRQTAGADPPLFSVGVRRHPPPTHVLV